MIECTKNSLFDRVALKINEFRLLHFTIDFFHVRYTTNTLISKQNQLNSDVDCQIARSNHLLRIQYSCLSSGCDINGRFCRSLFSLVHNTDIHSSTNILCYDIFANMCWNKINRRGNDVDQSH